MKVLNKYVKSMDRATLVKLKRLCHYFGLRDACDECNFFGKRGCQLTYDSKGELKILVPEEWVLPEANGEIQNKPVLNTELIVNKMRDLMNNCPKNDSGYRSRRFVSNEHNCKNCPMYKVACHSRKE